MNLKKLGRVAGQVTATRPNRSYRATGGLKVGLASSGGHGGNERKVGTSAVTCSGLVMG